MSELAQPEQYRFPRKKLGGGVFGLTSAKLLTTLATLLLVVVCLESFPIPKNVLFAFLVMVIGAFLAFAPYRGRTLDAWVPVVGAYWLRRVKGQRRHRAGVLDRPVEADGVVAKGRAPRLLRSVSIVPGQGDTETQRRMGLIRDTAIPGWLAVLRVNGSDFALRGSAQQDYQLAAWGRVMDWAAKSGHVSGFQWLERTYADSADEIGRDLTERLNMRSRTVHSYLQVIDEIAPQQPRHEAYLVLEFADVKLRRAARRTSKGIPGVTSLIVDDMLQVATQLERMRVKVDGVLGPRQLAALFRDSFDPEGRIERERARVVQRGREAGTSPKLAWPLGTEESWGWYRTDSCYTTTWWITEWPLAGVHADFAAALMMWPGCSRTVSVTMRPVEARRASWATRRSQAARKANRQHAEAAGFTTGVSGELEAADDAREDLERALGAATYRFAGFTTVTAPTLDDLEEANLAIGQAVHDSQMEITPLWGEQEVGFTTTLPLCRGLARRLGE